MTQRCNALMIASCMQHTCPTARMEIPNRLAPTPPSSFLREASPGGRCRRSDHPLAYSKKRTSIAYKLAKPPGQVRSGSPRPALTLVEMMDPRAYEDSVEDAASVSCGSLPLCSPISVELIALVSPYSDRAMIFRTSSRVDTKLSPKGNKRMALYSPPRD